MWETSPKPSVKHIATPVAGQTGEESTPLVLIGTNTFDVLYDIYSKGRITHQPVPHGYRVVLKILKGETQAGKQHNGSMV